MNDKQFAVYLAYLVQKLNNWKYKVFEKHSDMVGSSPCGYDASRLFSEAIKRFAPEIYDGTIPRVELYARVPGFLWPSKSIDDEGKDVVGMKIEETLARIERLGKELYEARFDDQRAYIRGQISILKEIAKEDD